MTKKQYKDILKSIPHKINMKIDSVRIYKILGNSEIILFGKNYKLEQEDFIII